MGHSNTIKAFIVILAFAVTGFFVYRKPPAVHSIKKESLNQALSTINGWEAGDHIPFDMKIVESLALDDYVNKTFTNGKDYISLYVGYYTSSDKVGAAHDPLVCFPGQGWNISNRTTGKILIENSQEGQINYSTMQVELNPFSKNLILYWFQANEITHSNTFLQKISVIFQKAKGSSEDNAFIRLTCNLSDKSEHECLELLQHFSKSFYPVFLNYIKE